MPGCLHRTTPLIAQSPHRAKNARWRPRHAMNGAPGRRHGNLLPEIRRMECGSHVIFYYEPVEGGILVGEILHKKMLPKKHGI